MSARGVTVFRWLVVALYAGFAIAVTPGGTSQGEFVFMFVTAIWLVIAIIAADWVNAGRRGGGD